MHVHPDLSPRGHISTLWIADHVDCAFKPLLCERLLSSDYFLARLALILDRTKTFVTENTLGDISRVFVPRSNNIRLNAKHKLF